jgi:class 3 adenylate cyclase
MTEDRQQRRLSTILAADVFGYSRLSAENEEETLRTLKAHRSVIDRLIARHEGRIFNTAGDSVLAEFGSAVEAVRCAIAIQEELRVRNAEIPADRRMDFRIGINVGDVLVDGDNLYGDGVNIAARLESIAAPGSTCISGSVFALVKNKLSYGFEDIGLQTVKNIPEPVPAYRLAPSPAVRTEKAKESRKANSFDWRWAPALMVAAVVGAGAFYWSERSKETTLRPADRVPDLQTTPKAAAALPAAPSAPGAASPTPMYSAQILKTEPPVGQLPTGATVLVDDNTCPAGQIKQIVIGNATTGQPRLRSCVARPTDVERAESPSNTPGPVSASAVPQLDAAALERMRPYVGNTVGGVSTVTGKPFAMTLKAGGVAEVKIEFASGGFSIDHGVWWIEPNGHFCVRYTRFAGGNLVCRALTDESGVVKAYTWDHRPNPWVFSKQAAR